MLVSIIGSEGYIGSNLSHELRQAGHTVKCYDKDHSYNTGVTYINLKYEAYWKPFINELKASNIIINLAAIVGYSAADSDPELTTKINADFPEYLADKLGQKIPILQISAADSIYGKQKKSSITEDILPNPISHYGKTKLAGEKAILKQGGKVLRLSSVFGTSAQMRWDNLIHNWIRTFIIEKKLEVYQPHAIRSFANINNVTTEIIHFIENFKEEPFIKNICTHTLSKKELAKRLIQLIPNTSFTINTENIDPEQRNYIVQSNYYGQHKTEQMEETFHKIIQNFTNSQNTLS